YAGDDAVALDVDKRRGSAEIDGQIVREQAVEPVEDHGPTFVTRPPRKSNLAAVTRLVTQAGRGCQPLLILPSLCSKCLRHVGQNFLMANFSVIVRLFLVVW